MINHSLEQIALVLFFAMAPVSELRVAIPLAIVQYDMSVLLAYALSVAGNLIPVILLLLLLPWGTMIASKLPVLKRIIDWVFARTRQRHSQRVEKLGKVALIFIVGIPLPMTGAWTGSLVAFLFGIPFKEAFPLIASGVGLAGVIVTILTLIGEGVLQI